MNKKNDEESKKGTLAAIEKIEQILNQYIDWDYKGILSEFLNQVKDAKARLKISVEIKPGNN